MHRALPLVNSSILQSSCLACPACPATSTLTATSTLSTPARFAPLPSSSATPRHFLEIPSFLCLLSNQKDLLPTPTPTPIQPPTSTLIRDGALSSRCDSPCCARPISLLRMQSKPKSPIPFNRREHPASCLAYTPPHTPAPSTSCDSRDQIRGWSPQEHRPTSRAFCSASQHHDTREAGYIKENQKTKGEEKGRKQIFKVSVVPAGRRRFVLDVCTAFLSTPDYVGGGGQRGEGTVDQH